MKTDNMNRPSDIQIHAGQSSHTPGRSLWHTDLEGKYWCDYTNHRTPKQLLHECLTTIEDLKRNHQELASEFPSASFAGDGLRELVEKWRADAAAKLERNRECSSIKDWPRPSCLETDAEMLLNCAKQLEALSHAPKNGDREIPSILFDGYAVLQSMPPEYRKRTSAENVGDVLDAVVSILRRECQSTEREK